MTTILFFGEWAVRSSLLILAGALLLLLLRVKNPSVRLSPGRPSWPVPW